MLTNRVRKHDPLSWVIYSKTALKAVLFLLFVVSIFALSSRVRTAFPIQSVKVYGVHQTDSADVQESLGPLVNKGFFAIDVEHIKDRLLQSPWVAKAVVQRVWPDKVLVTVTEKTAIARWNKDSLLSANGEIFSPDPKTYPADLPQLKGADNEQIVMLKQFKKISSQLAALHFKILRLEMTPDRSWSITLDNGVKLSAGRKDVLTHINHFVKVYPKVIGSRMAEVDYVDLRYPNGMAVKWKTTVT